MRIFVNLLTIWGRMILLIAGIGILYAYAMFQGGFVSWFLLYSFLPFVLYSSLLALYPFKFWKIERVIDQHMMYEAGDTVKVQVQITRKLPFPLYFLIMTDTCSVGQEKIMLFPLFKRKIFITYELEEIPRGELIFEEIKITSADFLGFIKKEHTWKVENKLVVYPKRQRLNLFFLEKHIGEGMLARGFNHKKETLVPTSVREYQRGDRLSWINWKMTAKKSDLMTKEFEQTEDHQYVICMDRSNQIEPDAFEKIVFYSASLFDELYKTGHHISLISVGVDRNVFRLKKSFDWRNQVLYHFAVVRNNAEQVLMQVVEGEKAELPERGTIVLITDQIRPHFLEGLKGFANNQRKVVVILSSKEGIPTYCTKIFNQNITIKAMDDDLALGTAEVKKTV